MSDADSDFEDALRLRDQGDTVGSLAILSRLTISPDATAAIHAVLGDVHWDAGNLPESVASFQKAIEISPRSELASLGLFHTLIESHDEEAAFAEMKRFLSIGKPQEYRTLLKELLESSKKTALRLAPWVAQITQE